MHCTKKYSFIFHRPLVRINETIRRKLTTLWSNEGQGNINPGISSFFLNRIKIRVLYLHRPRVPALQEFSRYPVSKRHRQRCCSTSVRRRWYCLANISIRSVISENLYETQWRTAPNSRVQILCFLSLHRGTDSYRNRNGSTIIVWMFLGSVEFLWMKPLLS